MSVRVVIFWPELSGYMAACWRALTACPDVELLVVAPAAAKPGVHSRFSAALMHDIPSQVIGTEEYLRGETLAERAASHRPDVLVLPGWGHPPVTALAFNSRLRNARRVMTMDTPLRGDLRQRLARLRIGRFLDRMDRVMVPGERSWSYARALLRIPEQKLRRGMYGIDYDRLSPLHAARADAPGGWPGRFLFVGRYEDEKGIDLLLAAYRQYRARSRQPWSLTCCGGGPWAQNIRDEPGASDRGFIPPEELAGVMLEHGAFVLPSRYDPWPLVIVEAAAAGLPVVHSEACGSAVEVVRNYYSGRGVATGDVDALADALLWCEAHADQLPEMGRRAQALAEPYSAQAWARRWQAVFQELANT